MQLGTCLGWFLWSLLPYSFSFIIWIVVSSTWKFKQRRNDEGKKWLLTLLFMISGGGALWILSRAMRADMQGICKKALVVLHWGLIAIGYGYLERIDPAFWRRRR